MINITYQGVKGSYTSQALEVLCNKYVIESCKVENEYFFKELFEAITEETLALIPVENSIAGNVTQTNDLFFTHDVEIIAETELSINHCIVCSNNCEDKEIIKNKEVHSHIQALLQCSDFINTHNLIATNANDTAGAIKELIESEDPSRYAIGPEFAVELYGGRILQRKIQNIEGNKTRFLLVKKKGTSYSFEKNLPRKNKSTFVLELKDDVGALFEVLKILKEDTINIKRIESRPHPTKHFRYIFLFDIEANLEDENKKDLLAEIENHCETFKLLGSYPSWNE